MRYLLGRAGIILFAIAASPAVAQPLDTTFTYQGTLSVSGVPVTGTYDLRFKLFSALAGGAQVGSTLCADNVQVSGGRFTVRVDFGAQFAGQQRFLEIEVRQDTGLSCGNTTGFTLLTSRQPMTATPHAAYSLTANTANSATTSPPQPSPAAPWRWTSPATASASPWKPLMAATPGSWS